MKPTDLARSRRGISLIEAVLYLLIALAIIVGGIVFYQQADLSRRVTETSRMVAGLQYQTRNLFKDQGSFGDIPLEGYIIKAEAVPDRFVDEGTYGDRLGYDGGNGSGSDDSGGDDTGSGGDNSGDNSGENPGDGADGGGDDGSSEPVTVGTRCEVTPDAPACAEGVPSGDFCLENPMSARCAVGGTLPSGGTIFGAPPHAPICEALPPGTVPACASNPTATMGEVCASGEEGFLICDHLQFEELELRGASFSQNTDSGAAYVWNAQSGAGNGGGNDPIEIGLVIEHSWGGQVSVYGGTNYFDITLWDLPREACMRLATVSEGGNGPLGSGISRIAFDDDSESREDFPLDAAEAEQFCANEENMVNVAYLKRPNAITPVDQAS